MVTAVLQVFVSLISKTTTFANENFCLVTISHVLFVELQVHLVCINSNYLLMDFLLFYFGLFFGNLKSL